MSLRARLLVGMAALALVLVAAAVVITRTTRDHLIGQVDDQLADTRSGLRGQPFDERPDDRLSSVYVGQIEDDGSVQALFTPNLRGDIEPPSFTAAQIAESIESERPFTVESANGGVRYRARTDVAPRGGFVHVLALPLTEVDETVQRLINTLIIATLAILAVVGLVTWWVIRLGIRPIKQMTHTATAIAGGDLTHRVPDVQPGTEAGDLGLALNQMLGRIEEAFATRAASEGRLRQFVADASHELRTPLTTVRGYAELYRTGGLADPDELGEAMRRTEQETVRMSALVEDLLALARLDQGRTLERLPVNLATVAADAARDAGAVAPDRAVTTQIEGPVVVTGDDSGIRQVVANLVGNALVHTPAGTPIELHVRAQNGRAVLAVTDHGPGMAPEVASRAFERFYRADPSRSRSRGGSGLGLSIVDAIIGAHGGTIGLDTTPGAGTTVRVELPLTPPPGPHSA